MSVLSKLITSHNTLPYNCYELGHTWTPNCSEAALDMASIVGQEAFSMYALLYLATQLLIQRKFTLSDTLNSGKSAIQSTAFLSCNSLFTLAAFCGARHLLGRLYLPLIGHLPAAVSSYFALLIERPARRSALAFYCANIASETILFGRWNRCRNQSNMAARFAQMSVNDQSTFSPRDQALFRAINSSSQNPLNHEMNAIGNLHSAMSQSFSTASSAQKSAQPIHLLSSLAKSPLALIPTSWTGIQPQHVLESSMFVCGTVGLMYLYAKRSFPKCWKSNRSDSTNQASACTDGNTCDLCSMRPKRHQDLINSALSLLLGDFGPQKIETVSINKPPKPIDSKRLTSNYFSMLKSILYRSHRTSNECLTADRLNCCLQATFSGSLRGFCVGFTAQSLFNLAMHLKHLMMNRRLNSTAGAPVVPLYSSIFKLDHLRLGGHMAMFVAVYRFISCLMHRLKGRYDHTQPAWASLVASFLPRAFISGIDLNLTQYMFWKSVENWFWNFADEREAQRRLMIHQCEQWIDRYVAFVQSDRKMFDKCEMSNQLSSDPIKCVEKMNLVARLSADAGTHHPLIESFSKIEKKAVFKPISKTTIKPTEIGSVPSIDATLSIKPKSISIFCDRSESKPRWIHRLIEKMAVRRLQQEQGFSVFDYFGSDTLLRIIYSASVAQLFYVAVMCPLDLRASYMRFLNRMTHNRFQKLNRNTIDLFGVPSSSGTPLYLPRLDPQHMSRHFKENIFLWMIWSKWSMLFLWFNLALYFLF